MYHTLNADHMEEPAGIPAASFHYFICKYNNFIWIQFQWPFSTHLILILVTNSNQLLLLLNLFLWKPERFVMAANAEIFTHLTKHMDKKKPVTMA